MRRVHPGRRPDDRLPELDEAAANVAEIFAEDDPFTSAMLLRRAAAILVGGRRTVAQPRHLSGLRLERADDAEGAEAERRRQVSIEGVESD